MSETESDEEPHRMGLARLAMARSLSCDLVPKSGGELVRSQKIDLPDDLGSYSSSSSGFASQNSESRIVTKLTNKVKLAAVDASNVETASLDKKQILVESKKAPPSTTDTQDCNAKGKYPPSDTSALTGAPKLSFLQSLHQKSFKRKSKKKEGTESCHVSRSSSPATSSLNLLKVPERSRSKSLTRLSNAFSNVQKLGTSTMQSNQKSFGELSQAILQNQATAAICPQVSSSSSITNGSKDLHKTRKVPSTTQPPACPVCPHCNKALELPPCMLDKAAPTHSLCSCPPPPFTQRPLPDSRRASCVNLSSTSLASERDGDGLRSSSSSSCLNLARNKIHPEEEFARNTNRGRAKMPNDSQKRCRKKYRAKYKRYGNLAPDLSSISNSKKILNRPLSPRDSENEQLSRPSSWYGFNKLVSLNASTDSCSSTEELNQANLKKNEQLLRQRSLSLGRLNDGGNGPPLASVSSTKNKQKNYLVGGLDSLLGTAELERYFPDRKVTIFLATWNMNSNPPPLELEDFLLPDDMEVMPDIYVIGTQESDDDKTEWQVRLQTTIGPSHVLLTSSSLGILHLCVFLRRDLIWFCSVPEDDSYSLRPGTYFKTKGAVAISLQFFGSRLLFINTHLFAHEEKLAQRIQNYKNIVRNVDLPKNLRVNKSKSHKDLTHRHDVIFWLGDLNFRIVGDRDAILDKIESSKKKRDYFDLLYFDQLQQARRKGEIFDGFDEAPIHFAPTFKFDVGTDQYDSSSKQRVPAYTDRILYKSTRDPIHCLRYDSFPLLQTSDHKPVWGMFTFKIRPGKDDVPLAAGLFQREVYLEGIKRRRRFFHQSSKNCQMQ